CASSRTGTWGYFDVW
nr:immunoglobulin heavy chain junction region [Mus musculus]